MRSAFLETVKKLCPGLKILLDEPMARHTSFRIGGNAAVMVFPGSREELAACLKSALSLDERPLILGAGTNVLAPDEGLDRIVICLKENFSEIRELDDTRIYACAGATLARLAVFARDMELTGLEFAHGIPGTVGGGVYMNAGAYGGEMKQVVESVTVLNGDGTFEEIAVTEDTFGYRTSIFENTDCIIVGAAFRLEKGSGETIRERMAELMQKRKASQPLELPSAGSTFKRPVGGYAAALIDEAGLKGLRVGDAAVSEKHAGFVVNLGAATGEDVKRLMAEIQKKVKERSGIDLTPEVRIW